MEEPEVNFAILVGIGIVMVAAMAGISLKLRKRIYDAGFHEGYIRASYDAYRAQQIRKASGIE